MSKIAITYSPIVGGSSVISLQESFKEVGSETIDADYRAMMAEISVDEFNQLYSTSEGRQQLFAHAKAKAMKLLEDVDCLALSGNTAMIDPILFKKERETGQTYDFSRTIAELALVHVATEKGMPILGVCGGHQVIAVHGGGEIAALNADQFDKQRFMNYDTIKVNKDSMLAQIIGGKRVKDDMSTPHYEGEFFGAHNQVVSKLGKGFKQTGIASDGQSLESAESEFGVPILTTQFHPEVGAKGLPNASFIYQRTQEEADTNLKIFEYLAKTAEAYHKKKTVMSELKQFKPKEDQVLIKPSQVKTAMTKEQEKNKSGPKIVPEKLKKPVFNWKGALGVSLIMGMVITATLFALFPPAGFAAATGLVGSAAIGGVLGALGVGTGFGLAYGFNVLANQLKIGIGALVRKIVSERLTRPKVQELREKEEAVAAPDNEAAKDKKSSSSFSTIFNELSKSPGELLRETPAQLWTKQDDDLNNVNVDEVVSKEDKELVEGLEKEESTRSLSLSSD